MIDQEFDFQNVASVNFGISLRSNGDMYFIPTDGAAKEALKGTLRTTRNIFEGLPDDWELHDISEDYGNRRRIYAPRGSEFMAELSAVYDAGALDDLTNIQDHAHDVSFYFAVFLDNQQRRAVGIRKATKLKGTLNARNRLMRLVDDTLMLIQDDVLGDRYFYRVLRDMSYEASKFRFRLSLACALHEIGLAPHFSGKCLRILVADPTDKLDARVSHHARAEPRVRLVQGLVGYCEPDLVFACLA